MLKEYGVEKLDPRENHYTDFVSNDQLKDNKRELGLFKQDGFYMADDFDETPLCFKEYV